MFDSLLHRSDFVVGVGAEVEDGVTTQEHAEEICEGSSEHCEIYEGRLVVAVLMAAV